MLWRIFIFQDENYSEHTEMQQNPLKIEYSSVKTAQLKPKKLYRHFPSSLHEHEEFY